MTATTRYVHLRSISGVIRASDTVADPWSSVTQRQNVTIFVAVFSIYLVDFAVNAGSFPLKHGVILTPYLPRLSPIVLSKPHRGHFAHLQTANGISLGYAPRLWLLCQRRHCPSGSYYQVVQRN